jgi:hypothetical protein
MQYIIQPNADGSYPDFSPAALADELVAACGSSFSMSTFGYTLEFDQTASGNEDAITTVITAHLTAPASVARALAFQLAGVEAYSRALDLNGGYPVVLSETTYWIQSDEVNKTRVIVFSGMGANIPSGIDWTCMDETVIPVNQAFATAAFTAGIEQSAAISKAANVHKANMQALAAADGATAVSVLGYDYTTGWPPTYKDH